MKTFLKIFIFLVISNLCLSKGYTHIFDQKIAAQPLIVKYDPTHGLVHIICMGIDNNYNGKFDEGDEKPSWWVMLKPGVKVPDTEEPDSLRKVMDFEMNSLSFPLRAYFKFGMIQDEGFIMLNVADTLKSFSLKNGIPVYENCGIYKAVDFFIDDNIIYAATANNEVQIVNTLNFNLVDTIKLSFKPNGILKFKKDEKDYLAVLNEGSFGQSDSKIEFFAKNNEKWDSVKTLVLGASANHFVKDSANIYIAMNASHEIKVIDISSMEILTSVHIGTNFYDGPRELFVNDDYIYVTTYAGDIRKVNKSKMELESIFEANNKLEGLDFINSDYIVAAGPFKKDSYQIDSTVAFFSSLLSAPEEPNSSSLKITTNQDNISINSESIIQDIEIFNYLGESIYKSNIINNNEFTINKFKIINGIYFIKVNLGNTVITKDFLILN